MSAHTMADIAGRHSCAETMRGMEETSQVKSSQVKSAFLKRSAFLAAASPTQAGSAFCAGAACGDRPARLR